MNEDREIQRKRLRRAFLITGAALLFYLASYIFLRETVSLKIPHPQPPPDAPSVPLDTGPLRSLLPDPVLSGLELLYSPMSRLEMGWSGKKVIFERVYARADNGQMFAL